MQKAFIKKGLKQHFEFGNVNYLPISALDRATSTKEDTSIAEECRKMQIIYKKYFLWTAKKFFGSDRTR